MIDDILNKEKDSKILFKQYMESSDRLSKAAAELTYNIAISIIEGYVKAGYRSVNISKSDMCWPNRNDWIQQVVNKFESEGFKITIESNIVKFEVSNG